MNTQKKMALADFVVEAANGFQSGDIAGVAILYAEMAEEAEKDDVMLPLTATIRRQAMGAKGEMSDGELAAWLKGWAYQFDPRTAAE